MSQNREVALLLLFLGACQMRSLTADPQPNMSGTPPPMEAGGSVPPAAEAGTSVPPGAEAGALTLDEQCVRSDLGPVTPLAAPCTGAPRACAPAEISCRSTGLANTLRAQLKACGTTCGEIAISFWSGCASDVWFPASGSLERGEVRACIRQLVLGQAWTCAPPNAWAKVYVDNCTLP